MNLSMRNVWLMFKLRLKLIFRNPTIAMFPPIAIGYVVIFKSIINNHRGPTIIWILSMAILFNTVMSGLMFSTIPLADEKEKNTLTVLLDSKVNGGEYIVGSALATVVIIVITNIIAVIVSGISWTLLPMGYFILISFITSIISVLFGDFIAIIVSNQILAGFLTLPLMFVLAIVPMFKSFNIVASKISDLTYSGIMMNFMIGSVATGTNHWGVFEIITLILWIVGSFLLFLVAYRKKGLA